MIPKMPARGLDPRVEWGFRIRSCSNENYRPDPIQLNRIRGRRTASQQPANDISVDAETVRRGRSAVDTIRLSLHVLVEAFYRFNRDDGWAIASHIALSILMAMFPFLIVVTALAGFIGSVNLAAEVARLMFAAWPREVAT